MNIIVEDGDKIALLEKISIENMQLYLCPYITHSDLRCYYGNDCRRAKCHFLFHDIKSCDKKCRFYCCNEYCQYLHIDDTIDKFQLIIYLQEFTDNENNIQQKKMATLIPIFYEYC
jgi:hypothetical protein